MANDSTCQEVNWVSKRKYNSDDVERARGFIKNYVKPWVKLQRDVRRTSTSGTMIGNKLPRSHYTYPITEADHIDNTSERMDNSQWVPFALAMNQSRKCVRASVDNSILESMQMIIHGEGGSGKSWLIRHIVKDIHNVFSEHSASSKNSKRVLLLAHQGTAAFNIKGRTICSALELTSFSRNAYPSHYVPLATLKGGQTKLKRLQDEFATVHLIVIDEFSVISCEMPYWIDQRLREIWPSCSHLPFGGRDMIFTGDSAQLDPVIPYSLSSPMSKIQSPVQRLGREIWESIPNICTLTSQNRGKYDPEWFAALRRLRSKCPTRMDVNLINTRVFTENQMPEWAASAKLIAYMNVDVNEANSRSLEASSSPIVRIRSKHSVQLKRIAKKREIEQKTINALLEEAEDINSSRDRVVSTSVKLAVGAPVTLTFNMEQSSGLCNGKNAVIYDFIFPSGSDLPIILVQITHLYDGPSFLSDEPNIIPVVPRRVSWSKRSSDLSVFREGLPLRLAYAMTVHKVQGLTCRKVIFHSSAIPNVSFAYVALSRVRSREDIVLTAPLTLEKLTAPTEVCTVFRNEELRVQDAVNNTTDATRQIVDTMKCIAIAHNGSLRPR